MILLLKTENLRELAETCNSGLRKLKLYETSKRFLHLLKLYRNLLYQVSDWNFAETFQYVSALLKLDWNLHIRLPLTETWRNPAETIQVSALLKLFRKFQVSIWFQQCFNFAETVFFQTSELCEFQKTPKLSIRAIRYSGLNGPNYEVSVIEKKIYIVGFKKWRKNICWRIRFSAMYTYRRHLLPPVWKTCPIPNLSLVCEYIILFSNKTF